MTVSTSAGGGLYWPGEKDQRDHVLRYDSNDRRRDEIILDIMDRLKSEVPSCQRLKAGKFLLKSSPLLEITEYGRSVHAEMEALLACARAGVSPRGGTLYTTTFPCHNCARHIVAAGISRVEYVEPYPKSKARELHSDSIRIVGEPENEDESKKGKVEFVPFIGIGPRRYFDLFSTRLSTGYPIKRKNEDGSVKDWEDRSARPRVPMLPTSYIEREELIVGELRDSIGAIRGRE